MDVKRHLCLKGHPCLCALSGCLFCSLCLELVCSVLIFSTCLKENLFPLSLLAQKHSTCRLNTQDV